MKTILTLCLILIFSFCLFAQSSLQDSHRDYPFIFQDSPAQLFTMRQFNQSYLSGYRLMARGMHAATSKTQITDMIQVGLLAFVFMPMTHEEGHRSILTANNIGSISQPYMNKHGAAYVNGVTDETLRQLRDTDLPTYIRLHAGGLESDYMLTRRVETLAAFGQDSFQYVKWEYWIRKLSIVQYFATGLIKYDIDLDEEKNELDRDIVGHDVYGAARHLHRPDMPFSRYTRYDDLSRAEKDYINRLGFRSFLNLLNPIVFGKTNFALNATTTWNAGLGYAMAPFGDFIDENLWIKHKSFNVHFYARQYQNKENWFHGGGLSLHDLDVFQQLSVTLAAHLWQQPENLMFATNQSFIGGALDADVRYFFYTTSGAWLDAVSIDLGFIYKTKGYLPEELALDKHFGFRIGTSLRL